MDHEAQKRELADMRARMEKQAADRAANLKAMRDAKANRRGENEEKRKAVQAQQEADPDAMMAAAADKQAPLTPEAPVTPEPPATPEPPSTEPGSLPRIEESPRAVPKTAPALSPLPTDKTNSPTATATSPKSAAAGKTAPSPKAARPPGRMARLYNAGHGHGRGDEVNEDGSWKL
eukprot:gnl/TRDRNA2_/TRDRNA2_169989_c1_seq1.p3 gnl/TRDRNA2_/TRDRNA2_169989_c1~~gnl/TRDRNA2_/TRDRNA2_169989_c1_seq1.p3  ORF type:complete len:176 (-),score=36.34 gnl/TRDRNA2_/TRDRNA2_169989_c1_seq1:98-625(-)